MTRTNTQVSTALVPIVLRNVASGIPFRITHLRLLCRSGDPSNHTALTNLLLLVRTGDEKEFVWKAPMAFPLREGEKGFVWKVFEAFLVNTIAQLRELQLQDPPHTIVSLPLGLVPNNVLLPLVEQEPILRLLIFQCLIITERFKQTEVGEDPLIIPDTELMIIILLVANYLLQRKDQAPKEGIDHDTEY